MENPPALASLVAISQLHQAYDGAAQLLESRLGVPICERCGKCCEQNTPFAFGVEAANAVSRLLGQGRGYTIQRRIEGWLLERHKECTIYQPLVGNKLTLGLDNKIRDEALAISRVQCPFYEERSCIIHEMRPLACRAYGVTRPVHNCSRRLGQEESLNRRIVIGGPAREELIADRAAVLDLVPKQTWRLSGFFPTMIFSLMWPESFEKLMANGLVASAKVVMTEPTLAVYEEAVIEAMTEKDLVLV